VSVRAKALIGLGAALAAVALLPSAAPAGPTSVTGESGAVKVVAAPGTSNRVEVVYRVAGVDQDGFSTWANFINDRARVVTPPQEPDCRQDGPTTSICLDATSYRGSPGTGDIFQVELRDGNDSFIANRGLGVFEILGGSGRDRIYGHRMVRVISSEDEPSRDCPGDELRGGPGNDKLRTGCGEDLLAGGSGNDRIDARDPSKKSLGGSLGSDLRDYVICGGGRDVAKVDRKDLVAEGCEVIRGGS
jgi:RTX calcium-binding nonapeptide repeat (4 copies)